MAKRELRSAPATTPTANGMLSVTMKMHVVYAPIPKKTTLPKDGYPQKPPTMFHPSAITANMKTFVRRRTQYPLRNRGASNRNTKAAASPAHFHFRLSTIPSRRSHSLNPIIANAMSSPQPSSPPSRHVNARIVPDPHASAPTRGDRRARQLSPGPLPGEYTHRGWTATVIGDAPPQKSLHLPLQRFPDVRMCNGDNAPHACRQGLAPKLGRAPLGDDDIRVAPGSRRYAS